MTFLYNEIRKRGNFMKKFLSILLCSLLVISLSGCSNKLLEVYPEIEQDFDKGDYDTLTELSEDYSLSYDELRSSFASNKTTNVLDQAFTLFSEEGEVFDLSSSSDEHTIYITFNFKNTQSKSSVTSTIQCSLNKENNSIQSYSFKYTDYDTWKGIGGTIIQGMEGFEEYRDGREIFNNLAEPDNANESKSLYEKEKIFDYQNDHFFICKDNVITMYSSRDLVPKGYTMYSVYMDNQIKQNRKDLDELEDQLNDYSEDLNTINDALKSSYD